LPKASRGLTGGEDSKKVFFLARILLFFLNLRRFSGFAEISTRMSARLARALIP
jgi:hypothetical protein